MSQVTENLIVIFKLLSSQIQKKSEEFKIEKIDKNSKILLSINSSRIPDCRIDILIKNNNDVEIRHYYSFDKKCVILESQDKHMIPNMISRFDETRRKPVEVKNLLENNKFEIECLHERVFGFFKKVEQYYDRRKMKAA